MSTTPASIKKHPIHPMLVGLPIGLFAFSLISDLFSLSPKASRLWIAVALYTLGGGIITALIAAIPGFVDYVAIKDRRVRRTATFHMLCNLTAVVVFALSFGIRVGVLDFTIHPAVLSVVGVGLLIVAGWLGGELVYVQRVSVAEENGSSSAQVSPPQPVPPGAEATIPLSPRPGEVKPSYHPSSS